MGGLPPSTQSVAPLWRNRNFMLLWSGQTISVFGSTISDLAFPLLVLALTGSPAQTGLVLALEAVPFLVFSLPVGAWVDRWNRKKVMILCNIGNALTLASIPFAMAIGHLTIVQLYLTSLTTGTLFVFYNLAAVSSLPQVVHKQQLTEATAAGYASASASSIIGQPISSFLFFSVGRALPFIVDAISYLVLVISLFWIRAEFQQERTVEPRNLREDILEGFLWLWRNPLLRFQAFLGAGLNFVVFTTTLIVILLAQRQHALPFTGLIFAIASVGSITGSLLAGRVQKRFSFGQVMIAASWIMV